jgi:hypothetical protein
VNTLGWFLVALAAWFALSIPVSLFVGAFIRVGQGGGR